MFYLLVFRYFFTCSYSFDLKQWSAKNKFIAEKCCSIINPHCVSQLTYADTHPMFTARSFPHFFRIVPSESQFNEPRLALLKEFNWTRLGTLYQNEAKYSLVRQSNPTLFKGTG